MKSLLITLSLLVSTVASADCTKLVGQYTCPKEIAQYIDGNEFDISYRPLIRSFILKDAKAENIYELNGWNPGMTTDGDIDTEVMVGAVCDQNTLILKHVASEPTLGLEIKQDWYFTETAKGLEVRTTLDGDEFGSFTCQRK